MNSDEVPWFCKYEDFKLGEKSTITRMASKPSETGKGVMWSTEICSNGDWAGGRDEERLGAVVALF